MSIFTTAISVGTSFIRNINKSKEKSNWLIAFMCLSSIIFSNFGFTNLINLIYPILGILGLLQIYYILKNKI